MSAAGLAVVGAIYLAVAFDFVRQHNPGMALSFLCYAGANVGFIWSTMK